MRCEGARGENGRQRAGSHLRLVRQLWHLPLPTRASNCVQVKAAPSQPITATSVGEKCR